MSSRTSIQSPPLSPSPPAFSLQALTRSMPILWLGMVVVQVICWSSAALRSATNTNQIILLRRADRVRILAVRGDRSLHYVAPVLVVVLSRYVNIAGN